MELQKAINWRYATKRMTNKKVDDFHLNQIMEAIRLSPSSRGLQPYKVFVTDTQEWKERIQPIADNQPQIVECSHLLIFCVETSTTREKLETYIAHLATERNLAVEKLEGLKKVLFRDQLVMNDEQYYHWAAKQAYIALAYGQLMANTLGIDAAAMEGFNAKELDELLGLKSIGLRSAVLLALGHRDEATDYMLKLKKVRKTQDELFQSIH
jgi:nitroreductase